MTKKVAVVLGGTDDHTALVKILKSKGYYTVLVDYYENPPAKQAADEHIRESTLDQGKVLEIARERNVSIVMAACIDQALLTMAYVCEKLKLPCHISYNTALELTNKAYMKQKFIDNGIPTSRCRILSNGESLGELGLSFPLVVKPSDANGSKGVEKVRDDNELEASVKKAFSISRSKKVVVEEYVEGEEFSVDVAVNDGVPTVVMATKNIKNKNNEKNFTITQSVYPATTDAGTMAKIEQVAKQIIDAYHLKNGPLLMQLLHKDGVINVIEFSSRIGGGSKHMLIKKMTNFNMLLYFVCQILGESYEGKVEKPYDYGIIQYLYTKPGILSEFVGFGALEQQKVLDEVFFYKTLGMEVDGFTVSGDRSAGFLIADNDLERFKQRLQRADTELKILNENNEDIRIHF